MKWTDKNKTNAIEIILSRITEGESVRDILPVKDRPENLPHRDTFYTWLKEDEQLADQYARASDERAVKIFEEMFEIADDGRNDWMEIIDRDGECIGWRVNGEAVQRSKLRIDTRKWSLSKMNPKKYGDISKHIHEGGDPDKPVKISFKD